MNWKSFFTWLTGFMAPGLPILLPDMQAGRAPSAEHLWQALAAAIIGTFLVSIKRPGDHADPPDAPTGWTEPTHEGSVISMHPPAIPPARPTSKPDGSS